ncbi:chloramphenicol-sensitive protein RarD [Sphingopyxis italica]|uniref:Chloramphenicol-sensitive protein RarD n=1 Tax=Sphingopyxis italica TaxID=1129133 RepID=A0A7X5XTX5_9SPHN|nr:EamA family transporter RarD [Sphingopyxis italica]NJB91239.1 chloramphenicol-sensitive protein RarD [Sphingopyxis italica]
MAQTPAPAGSNEGGLPYAVAAYGIWGFVPLFFKLISSVPPVEVLAQRIIWSLPLCFVIMLFRRQIGEYLVALKDWRTLRLLLASSLLIAVNWLVYIYSIFTDHVLAASLGYYLNPLVNVMLGMIFLGERLSRLQLVAVAIAGVGVAILLAGALDTLWISLTLAFSFGTYGLIRKVVPVGSLPGLSVETTVLLLPSLGIAAWYLWAGDGRGFGSDSSISLLLMAGGVITAVPLLLFATAARRMSYAALGFVQFLAPTLQFLLSLFVFHEPLKPAQLACFVLIWISIAVFSFDMLRKMRAERMIEVA